MKPNTDNIRTPTPGQRATLTRAQRADPLRPYFAEVGSHELFTPEEEVERARDIEATELECWRALLTHPSTTEYVIARIFELAGDDLADASGLLSAAHAAARYRTKSSRGEMEQQADQLAHGLRAISAHWDLLETVIAHMCALLDDDDDDTGARPRRFRPRSKSYAAWLARVLAAQRAAARARNRFVNANLRLVFHTARRFLGSGIPFADLIQEGNLGLIRAIDKFDHHRGLRFSTYAGWWIRHMIGRAVNNRSRAVRVPVYLLELRGRIERTAADLERELGRLPSDAEIAAAAGVPEDKIEETRIYCQSYELSLDDTVGRDDERSTSRHDVFADPVNENTGPYEAAAAADDRSRLAELLAELPARERDVIEKRFGLEESGREWTLREIAEQHDLSRERIRQIEKKAMQMMREAFERRDQAA